MIAWVLSASSAVGGRPAAAQEISSLATFIAAGRDRAFENREARVLRDLRTAERGEAVAALIPFATATAGYTRNQYEVTARVPAAPGEAPVEGVFVAQDQLDATFALEVPLLNVSSYYRLAAAGTREDAARLQVEAARDDIDLRVSRAYFGVLSTDMVVRSAELARDTAHRNLDVVSTRRQSGLASELDYERAQSRLEHVNYTLADARLEKARSTRTLRTLTGIEARGVAPALDVSTHDEPPLEHWLRGADDRASTRAAVAEAAADDAASTAAWSEHLPTISATASERLTNAPGFGVSPAWAVGVRATLRIDMGTSARVSAARARAAVARVRAEKVARDVRDNVEDAWNVIESARARVVATRAEAGAAQRASDVARTRYQAGTATQLDVVTADRDLLAADVARVRAETDLAFARVQLRILTGRTDEVL